MQGVPLSSCLLGPSERLI